MVGNNASGFDNYNFFNSLPKSYTSTKKLKTSRGLIKLSFKAGSAHEDVRELPKNVKVVYSKCHISGSLKDIQKEYNIRPELLQGEIAHDLITLSNYRKDENQGNP